MTLPQLHVRWGAAATTTLCPGKSLMARSIATLGQVHWSLLLQRFQRIYYPTLSPKSSRPCPLWAPGTSIPMPLPCCPLDPQLSLPSAASRKVEQTSTRSNETRAWLVTSDGSETIFPGDRALNGSSWHSDTWAQHNRPSFAQWSFNAHFPPKQDS